MKSESLPFDVLVFEQDQSRMEQLVAAVQLSDFPRRHLHLCASESVLTALGRLLNEPFDLVIVDTSTSEGAMIARQAVRRARHVIAIATGVFDDTADPSKKRVEVISASRCSDVQRMSNQIIRATVSLRDNRRKRRSERSMCPERN